MARIVVGGYLRTGTTLVQQLLCSAPGTNPLVGEAVYLLAYVENLNRTRRVFELHGKDYFADLADLARFTAGQLEAFLARTAARLGDPPHLVLKHPHLTPYLPQLHFLAPDLVFVVVVRDPRDTVASALQAGARGAVEFAGADARTIAQRWRATYAMALGPKLPAYRRQLALVRYEDVVVDPVAALAPVARLTGLDLRGVAGAASSGRVDFDSEARVADPLTSTLYGQAPVASRVGRWRETLSPADAHSVEAACGDLMDQLGYPRG